MGATFVSREPSGGLGVLEVQLLGPIEARRGPQPVDLGSRQRRVVLACLASTPLAPWSHDALFEALWGEEAPEAASRLLRSLVSHLRRALEPGRDPHDPRGVLNATAGGYVLDLPRDAIDLCRFEDLSRSGQEALGNGDFVEASAALERALAMWRGDAFGEARSVGALLASARHAEELRALTLEALAEARVRLGDARSMVAELEKAVEAHPYRESLIALLMRAYYQAGRQADALAVFAAARDRLVDDLGVDPGPELRRLEHSILTHDPSLDLTPTGVVGAPARILGADDRTPFVGREAELDAVDRALQASDTEGRRVLLVAGEPGIGKTRLLTEAARRAAAGGATVLAGRCSQDAGVPYLPFVEALQEFASSTPAEHLPRLLGASAGELIRLAPSLRTLVPGLGEPTDADPDTERYRLFESVAQWLSAASRTGPLMVVLDDIHWAGRPTVELLRHLLGAPATGHVLVVAAYRDTDVGPNEALADLLADLHRVPGVDRILLRGFDVAEVSAILGTSPVPESDLHEIAARVHDLTAGNAFLVTETVRDARRSGRLEPPTSVADMVEARVRQLPEGAADLLRAGAVQGPEFHLEVIANAARIDMEDAVELTEAALGAGLLAEAPDRPDRFSFRHALVRAALLDRMSGTRRRRVHARIGEILASRPAVSVAPTEPARHLLAAGDAADAELTVAQCREAAQASLAAFSFEDAAWFSDQALERLGDRSDALRAELLVLKGQAARAMGDPSFRDQLLEAIGLAQRTGSSSLLARAALANRRQYWMTGGQVDEAQVAALEAALELLDADDIRRVQLLSTLAAELGFLADPARSRAMADEAITLARAHGDPDVVADVLVHRRLSVWDPEVARRYEFASELAATAARVRNPLIRWQAHAACIVPFVEVGDLDAAQRHADEVDALADHLGDPRPRWTATYHRALLAQIRGDLDDAERLTRSAAEIGHPGGEIESLLAHAGQQYFQCFDRGDFQECLSVYSLAKDFGDVGPEALPAGALLYAEVGEASEGRALLTDFVRSLEETDRRSPIWTVNLCLAGEAAARLGDTEAARTLLGHLEPESGSLGVTSAFSPGPVDRSLALLHATLGDHTAAERRFRSALSLTVRIGAKGFAARTRLDLAEWMLTHHPESSDAAATLLEEATAGARECGLRSVLERASRIRSTSERQER